MNILFLCLVCGACSGVVLILLFWPKTKRRLLTGLYILYITAITCFKQVFLAHAAGYFLFLREKLSLSEDEIQKMINDER